MQIVAHVIATMIVWSIGFGTAAILSASSAASRAEEAQSLCADCPYARGKED